MKERKIDSRLISSSNKELQQDVAKSIKRVIMKQSTWLKFYTNSTIYENMLDSTLFLFLFLFLLLLPIHFGPKLSSSNWYALVFNLDDFVRIAKTEYKFVISATNVYQQNLYFEYQALV